MLILFYIAAAVAVLATVFAVTRGNAVHALLFFVLSLISTALVLFLVGAPLVAALVIIVYAGAIVVVFLFAVMLIGLDEEELARERLWIRPRAWLVPGAIFVLVAAALLLATGSVEPLDVPIGVGDPRDVGRALFGPYLLAVELASFLLLAGLLGAFHVGRRLRQGRWREEGER